MAAASNSITFRVSAEQMQVISNYAKFQDKPLSTLVREAFLEKVEDAYDYETGTQALKEHLKHPKDVISLEEFGKKMGFV